MAEVDEIRQEARRNTRGRFEQWAKNPTCEANTLSAVHNVRLDKAAEAVGLDVSFGQSPFAIARGNRFEAGLFYDDAAEAARGAGAQGVPAGGLDRLPRPAAQAERRHADHLGRPSARRDRGRGCGGSPPSPAAAESIVAAPMIKIPKGVILPEALLIIDAVTVTTTVDGRPRITVGEVKVFPDRGGHTDPRQLASARAQAGVYEHALRTRRRPRSGLPTTSTSPPTGSSSSPGRGPTRRRSERTRTSPIRPSAPSGDSSGWRRSPSASSATTTSPPTTRR